LVTAPWTATGFNSRFDLDVIDELRRPQRHYAAFNLNENWIPQQKMVQAAIDAAHGCFYPKACPTRRPIPRLIRLIHYSDSCVTSDTLPMTQVN